MSEINDAHPALSDLFDDAIVANCVADHGGKNVCGLIVG
jgi:hypothetical protein